MKIRTDFVTNSSSSSFIIGFRDENDLKKMVAEIPEEYRETVEADILKGVCSYEDIEGEVIEDLKWSASWIARDRLEDEIGWSKAMRYEYEHEAEFKTLTKQVFDELLEKFRSNAHCTNYSRVEYSDHVSPELEHEIMPLFRGTIKRISYH